MGVIGTIIKLLLLIGVGAVPFLYCCIVIGAEADRQLEEMQRRKKEQDKNKEE